MDNEAASVILLIARTKTAGIIANRCVLTIVFTGHGPVDTNSKVAACAVATDLHVHTV